nr:uncharacterized protein LOC102149563 [Equus caballus]
MQAVGSKYWGTKRRWTQGPSGLGSQECGMGHCTCLARTCLSPWRVRELRRGLPGGASLAGLSRRPPYAGARARRHRLPGTCRAPLAFPALPPRPLRPPEPTDLGRCLRVRGSGVERCGEQEAPRSERRERRGGSEHRARARPRRRSLRARARGGGGAHVRVFVSEPDGRPPAGSFSQRVGDPDLEWRRDRYKERRRSLMLDSSLKYGGLQFGAVTTDMLLSRPELLIHNKKRTLAG